jgi:hypothetical protein
MRQVLLITAALMFGLMAGAQRWAPKPEIDIVVRPDGGASVHLLCPDGWVGYSEWRTIAGLKVEEQWREYLSDAKKGVCKRRVL